MRDHPKAQNKDKDPKAQTKKERTTKWDLQEEANQVDLYLKVRKTIPPLFLRTFLFA